MRTTPRREGPEACVGLVGIAGTAEVKARKARVMPKKGVGCDESAVVDRAQGPLSQEGIFPSGVREGTGDEGAGVGLRAKSRSTNTNCAELVPAHTGDGRRGP